MNGSLPQFLCEWDEDGGGGTEGEAGRTCRGVVLTKPDTGRGSGLESSKDWPVCQGAAPPLSSQPRGACCHQSSSSATRSLQTRGGERGKRKPPHPHLLFLPHSAGFCLFFFLIQPLCGPIRGLLPPPTSSLVAVTRQTFLVVTAGLVELSSSTGMGFKKRVSQTTATLNSNAA